jgi:hypothetical protein
MTVSRCLGVLHPYMKVQYLADAGFPLCDGLLVPYRGVRYHLKEWGRASERYVQAFNYLSTMV